MQKIVMLHQGLIIEMEKKKFKDDVLINDVTQKST